MCDENEVMCDEDVKYRLTPWGCLCAVLMDYGIDVGRISGKVGGHIVDDFMEVMEVAGYIMKDDEEVVD